MHDYDTEWHSLAARRHSTLVGGCNVGEGCGIQMVRLLCFVGLRISLQQNKAVVRPILLHA